MIAFCVGVFVGAPIGLFFASLAQAAGRSETLGPQPQDAEGMALADQAEAGSRFFEEPHPPTPTRR